MSITTILLFLVLSLLVVSPLMVIISYVHLQIANADNFQSFNTNNGISRSIMYMRGAHSSSSQHTIIKNENPFSSSPVSSTNISSYANGGNGDGHATMLPSSSPSPSSKPLLRLPMTDKTQGSPKSCDASIGVSCFQQGLISGLSNGAGNAQIGGPYNDSCIGGSTNLDGPGSFIINQTADNFCKGFHEGYVTGYYNLTLENAHP